ncbi:dipeptidyl-peptidase 3 family protein [Aurantibacillus circumpalustris]|uniref:dipeptidyl-peptidase 3 family protein n=1 Tax=Aurantibacillus circumpalustris TaxID=3036359 RepID=UPI00295B8D34|nr:dihydrofolate reductase [Aurantibacillus circumpalustris]
MKNYLTIAALTVVLASCQSSDNELAGLKKETVTDSVKPATDFKYIAEQFADLRVLRYHVDGFENLDLKTKTLLYYLSEAALCGRDMNYDQNYKYNLVIRKTLESILSMENHDSESEDFKKLEIYAKRVWFSNGIHHHYNNDKFIPECSEEFFTHVISHVEGDQLPLQAGQSKEDFIKFITPLIFDPTIAAKKVSLDSKKDLVKSSAVNFYEGVTQKEAVDFYAAQVNKKSEQNPMYGLNSKLMKENGKLVEKIYKVGGMYSPSIEKIVYWLEKAITVAENENQKASLEALVKFYKTGSLEDFDLYNIAWVKDTESAVDVVNGFIEVYQDPLGKKGSFESVVSIKDFEASKRIATIGANAQWFEDNSPLLPQHKKKDVKGISAKVINAVMESGDAAPSTPIGINLPNNEWIREVHGSKSVNLGNIVEAYDQAAGGSVVNEFYYNDEIKQRVIKYGSLSDKLHTDMHEVIGHASGVIEKGVGSSSETLKNYASALEEGRADLVALYYLMDPKLIDLGVMPNLECGKAAYDEYITKGLIVQLSRIKPGKEIEEAHMRNRKMVAAWVFEKGAKENVIEKKFENEKTYYVVNDYAKLRVLFGDLLREIQRVKSQGDYKAGHDLIENYGVKIDPTLHTEIIARYEKLKIAPYAGFIQPKLVPTMEGDKVIDVKIEYPENFTQQMLEYGKNYGLLPAYN